MKKIVITLIGMAIAVSPVFATDRYVALNGNHVSPFTNWATAATNIQDAISACSSGDVVWVTNGTYDTGMVLLTPPGSTLSNSRVAITNSVSVKSMNGATNTIIKGGTEVRGVFMISTASLTGFKVIDGNTTTHGPGIFGGNVYSCIISNNTGGDGGGCCVCNSIHDSEISYNTVNCKEEKGGGINGCSSVYNCLVKNNYASTKGGGVNESVLYNSTIISNRADSYNSDNVDWSTLWNCIVQDGNDSSPVHANTYNYSCSIYASGDNNITVNPQFIDSANANYRLQATSPCINVGLNQDWMLTATDLDGNDRIISSVVDMGAYEYGSITVPVSPENIQASDGTYTNKVLITWSAASEATGYQIFRYTANDSTSADQIGITASTTYDDTNAPADTTYYYWVKATNSAGASAFSSYDTGWRAQSVVAPSVPTGISASDGTYTDKVLITWSAASEATGYQIFRYTANDSTSADQIGITASTTYDDTSASADTTYYYWIKSTNSAGASAFSSYDTGYKTPSTSTLTTPTNVSASDGTYTNKVRVTWAEVSGAGNYEVWRNTESSTNGASQIADTVSTTNDDTNVTANVSYYYWVRAKNPAATSGFSLPNSGYASAGDTTKSADLSVLSFLFLPTVMSVGDHPGAVSVQLINYGPDDLISPNTRLTFNLYLSANAFFGDGDDVWMGDYSCDKTLGASSYTTVVVPSSGREELTVPSGLASGNYYVFIRVQHESPSTLMDPDLSNNYVIREGVISITGSSNLGYHLFNDYDKDGKSDIALYKESTGEWLILLSGSGYSPESIVLGGAGFKPVLADYDGDGKSDPAVCKKSTGDWKIMMSASDYETTLLVFGENGCIPVSMDYDGDGKADPTVYREAASTWEVMRSADNYTSFTVAFGGNGRTPVPADYDGDGISDMATYRDSTGDWAVMLSSLSYWTMDFNFGGHGTTPVPADYDGDGKADPAVYKETSGDWSVMMSRFNYLPASGSFGGHGWVPVHADYDGDGKEDIAIYNDDQHVLNVLISGNAYDLITLEVGGTGYEPVGWPQ